MAPGVRRHIPNALTLARLVLAAVLFAMIAVGRPAADGPTAFWATAFALYVVAAVTDLLDGYLARRWDVTSGFGRVVDPFVDKILILGCFALFCGANLFDGGRGGFVTGVSAPMVVVLVARELLVTTLRGYVESLGLPFGADWFGKAKTLTQVLAVGGVLLSLDWEAPLARVGLWAAFVWARDALLWTTVLTTVLSGANYCVKAARLRLPTEGRGS